MIRASAGWDVDSPVQAEVFVVWLEGDRVALTDPDDTARRAARR